MRSGATGASLTGGFGRDSSRLPGAPIPITTLTGGTSLRRRGITSSELKTRFRQLVLHLETFKGEGAVEVVAELLQVGGVLLVEGVNVDGWLLWKGLLLCEGSLQVGDIICDLKEWVPIYIGFGDCLG